MCGFLCSSDSFCYNSMVGGGGGGGARGKVE